VFETQQRQQHFTFYDNRSDFYTTRTHEHAHEKRVNGTKRRSRRRRRRRRVQSILVIIIVIANGGDNF
jgi:hypothetical protein